MEELFKLLEQLAERNQTQDQFTREDVEGILKDPSVSLRLAVSSASGAQNRIARAGGDPDGAQVADVSLCQRQAGIWLAIHERQLEMEDRAEAARTAEILNKQAGNQPGYSTRISQAFEQRNINRPVVNRFGASDDREDASSGNEDKPVT